VCGVGVAAVAGWLLAGGSLRLPETLLGHLAPGAAQTVAGTAPVHLDSTPSRAQVSIDGARVGWTPLDVRLSPGQHALSLQHPDALDQDQTLAIPESGATVSFELWRRRPDVVPLRPVYPGASLVDARFLDDGQVALLVSLPAQSGALSATRELWRLDAATGQPSRVVIPGTETPVATMALEPAGQRVAYVTPGTSSGMTASLWPTSGRAPTGPQQTSHPEAVWVAPVDGAGPSQRVLELPSASGPVPSSEPERIVDLVWTPDGARLVAITRQAGPPARARVVVLNVPAPADATSQPLANERVLLPAEVVPGSLVPDASGRWLALVTHAATASGGSDLLTLCVLELRPDGAFRDLADLGSAARLPAAAPMTWAPANSSPDRLVFVAPTPASPSGGGPFGLFGLFGALRAAAPPSGLFLANLAGADLAAAQPRRLATAINTVGPVWRSETTLFRLARQDDGTLTLRAIDAASGAVRDLGVRLPAGTGQGLGLSARWDTRHGRALVLARPSVAGTVGNGASGGALQAWLVSFVSPSAAR
jgi:hypothetical protein